MFGYADNLRNGNSYVYSIGDHLIRNFTTADNRISIALPLSCGIQNTTDPEYARLEIHRETDGSRAWNVRSIPQIFLFDEDGYLIGSRPA